MKDHKWVKSQLTSQNIKSALKQNDTLLTVLNEIAEGLNEHFNEISVNLNRARPTVNTDATDYKQGNYQDPIFIPPVSSTDVNNTIKTLKNINRNMKTSLSF